MGPFSVLCALNPLLQPPNVRNYQRRSSALAARTFTFLRLMASAVCTGKFHLLQFKCTLESMVLMPSQLGSFALRGDGPWAQSNYWRASRDHRHACAWHRRCSGWRAQPQFCYNKQWQRLDLGQGARSKPFIIQFLCNTDIVARISLVSLGMANAVTKWNPFLSIF